VKWQKIVMHGVKQDGPFPAPGTKWQPLHRTPHQNNKPISIRRAIALAKEKQL
jgi:hypothetical protein